MKRISENSGRNEIDGFEEYTLRRKKRAIWTAAGCVLAALMAVGISFALRSQGRALTAERRVLDCSYSVHQHSDDCYDVDGSLTCGMANYVIHYHNDDCYDENHELVCLLPDPDPKWEEHTHEDSCYDVDGNLTCEKLVVDVHTHDEKCFKIEEIVLAETTDSGATGQGTTNSGITGQGTTGTQNSGTVGNQDSGITGNQNSEAAGNQDSEITGNQDSENKDNQNSGAAGNQDSENKDNQNSGAAGSQDSENKDNHNSGAAGNQDSENKDDQKPEPPETLEPEWTYMKTSRTYEDAEIKIEVSYPFYALIPDQAELVVRKLSGSEYKAALADAESAMNKKSAEMDMKFAPGAVAYDISFIYVDKVNGKVYEFEPADGVMEVTFDFKDNVYENGDDLTIIHMGEEQIEINEDVEVNDGKSTIEISSFSIVIAGRPIPVESQSLFNNVVNVEFYTKQGSMWVPKNKEADGQYFFNSEDSIKARIQCQEIREKILGSGAYIPLPKSISFPKEMMGKEYAYNDDDYANAGVYWLSCDNNGTPYVFFEFTDEYLKWVRQNRGGKIQNLFFQFEFTWNVKQTDGKEEQEDIYLGDFKGTVKIKTKDQSNNSHQSLGYEAYKNAVETKYDEKGNMLIRYEIGMNVAKHLDNVIELRDTITYGTEFYDLTWQYNGQSGQHEDYVKLNRVNDTEKVIVIGYPSDNQSGKKKGVDAGYYVISYWASFNVGKLQNAKVDSVKNTITYGDGKYHSSTETFTRPNSMTKNGSVENVNTGEVKWIVRINDGSTPYTSTTDVTFTDTLPKGTILVDGTMKITQCDRNWNETENAQNDWKAEKQQDGTTLITATLPKGAYRYQIEYMTRQDTPPTPGAVTKVKNDAKISGGINGQASVEVTLKPEAVTKTMGKVLTTKKEFYPNSTDSNKREVFEIAWSVALASVNAGNEYIDEGLNANWVVPLLMSPKQIDGIVVKCGDKTLVKDMDYTITPADDSGNFLFKIKFLKDWKEKVTIDYTCYADVTNVAGDGFNVRNVFNGVEAGDWVAKEYRTQSTNLYKYVKGSDANESNRYAQSKIAIGTENTLHWVIVAEPNCTPKAPFVFKDTLPKGLSFDETTLKITAQWGDILLTKGTHYDYKIDKDSNGNDVITLTVDLAKKKVGYKDFGYERSENLDILEKLVITYDTTITDSAFLNGSNLSKEYTNTVDWDGNSVDQNVTVTRNVIGKHGSFDASTGILKYSVIINPYGTDLNPGGKLLRVEDKLTGPSGIKFQLSGVELYDLTNVNGSKEPGSLIRKLEPLPSKPAGDGGEYTYYYDDKTYAITAYIPDEKACALVYAYKITNYKDVAEDIDVSNTASLYGGSTSYASTQEKTKVLKYTMGAGVDTLPVSLYLEKYDAASHDTLLAGAEFTVSKWDETNGGKGNWVKHKVYKTEDDGKAALDELESDVLYQIKETKAPDKYAVNPEIKYFVLSNDPGNVSVPDGVTGAVGEDTDIRSITVKDITIYPYGKDQNGNNITSVMEWTDERLGTELLVRKEWEDGSYKKIERLNGKLTFDLYRKTVPKKDASGYSEGKTFIYKLTDEELETIKNKYDDYKLSHGNEYVKEYTLDPKETDGKWELTISGLEQTDDSGNNVYQYYLVETSMDTGSETDQLLDVKYDVTLGTDSSPAVITVTNRIVSDYSLPETGAGGSWLDRIISWFKNVIGI